MRRAARLGSFAAVAATAHTVVNLRLLRRPPAEAQVGEPVSVLLPVRDEVSRAGPCLAAVLASRGVADLEVLVLDDGSSDATADLVRAVAGRDPRVHLITGRALPPGWLGKPHACAQLAAAARGEVLVFLDADVVLAPDGLARAVATLEGLDLVCPYPRQRAESLAERLVQPLLQWSWLTFLPVRFAERSPRPSLAAANGQLLVVRAAAYAAAGGHA
ncbi:MAG: glycosyltransferase family 2 protein, partial [Mycobacteriales bacterium]